MIGTIDVKINAAHPNLPLAPLFVFVGSPAAPRVINVPKKIGNWEITRVFASATFPDDTSRTVEMKNVAGCYVGTIPASDTSGASEGGFQITADGRDENGNAVSGYCLGRGDIFVLNRDGTVSPDVIRHYVHGYTVKPEDPHDFDLAPASAAPAAPLELFLNGAWRPLGLTFAPVGGVTPTVKDGVANLTGLFGESNTLLAATIDARLPYPLYAVTAEPGLLKDRALNTTSLASVTVPDNFTDLLIRASVASSLPVEMPKAIATKYGDTFPGEAGEYLITITKTGAAEAYVRVIKLEVANA